MRAIWNGVVVAESAGGQALHPAGRRCQNRDAAWYFPGPAPAAAEIRDWAFWKGVRVVDDDAPATTRRGRGSRKRA